MKRDLTHNIRRLYNQGMSQQELARRYGVSQASIHYALKGRKRTVPKKKPLVSWRAKLKPAQVRRLRTMYTSGKHTMAELANRFGISQATVSNILSGKVYRRVT